MDPTRLFLIDATAFCYRAFYALPAFATSFGQPTNAVYGFITMLNRILRENSPEYLGACFDVSRQTFRQEKFAEYKMQRPPAPDGLISQVPLIKQALSAYGIPVLEKEGYEADDVIATLSLKAVSQGIPVTVVSSDKDILQLVDEKVTVLSPYKDTGTLYDAKKVYERFGVSARQIPDIIALMGDAADNIPGIPGIGEKTAVSLIGEFGSVGNLLKHIDTVKQAAVKKTLAEHRDTITLNLELAQLCSDVDIVFSLKDLRVKDPDVQALSVLFKRLEFKKFLRDLPATQEKETLSVLEHATESELRDLCAGGSELYLYAPERGELFCATQSKFLAATPQGEGIQALLASAHIKKIGHGLKEIKVSLAKQGVRLEGLSFDTLIGAYLLNPSHSEPNLAQAAWEYLERTGTLKDCQPQQCLELLMELKPRIEKGLCEKGLFKLFSDIEMPFVEVLVEMEYNGITLDQEVLKALSVDIEKRLIQLIDEIYGLSGVQFNINSPKQLRDILFDRLGLPVVKKGKTGPSTDEEVLKALSEKHKLPALLLEYRHLAKLKNTYVDVLPELIDTQTGKVHTSFNQAGTETGRLSSSNPNLQNIPVKTEIGRNLRKAIIASCADSRLLSCDYSQIELRVLAHLSKDEGLIDAFLHNKDVHKATAGLIYGLAEADVTDQMREVAKRVNFGIIYGLTSYGLSKDLGIAVEAAQNFIDAYFMRYPRVKVFIEEQIKKARTLGYVTTLLGRRRYVPEINNKNQAIRAFAERQVVNTPIQGSASDLMKLAMLDIHKAIHEKKLNAKMILQIHDELVFEVKASFVKDAASFVRNRMEQAMSLEVPLSVDIKQGKNWLEMEPV